MNCKPGDLALIIKGCNTGKAVTCVRLAGPQLSTPNGPRMTMFGMRPIWEIDKSVVWASKHDGDVLLPYMPDECLMPIRPEPDERHVITGKIRVTAVDTNVLEQILLGDRA